jgi:glucose-1-phosphate cytidylyltransferase
MQVLILCGGQGTRAYPFTRKMPKALMPVAGLPILEQVMRIYASQGFDEFVLAVGFLKEDIMRYFRTRRMPFSVECIDTGETTDTGGRVRRCLGYLGETFHATYCDGLGDVDLTALVEFHERHGDGATVTAAPLRSQYGILQTDPDDRITEFVEKPVLREYWINAGFFVFDRAAFNGIDGENLERDVLPEMARLGRLRVRRHHGFWRSMDTHKDQQELDGIWRPYAKSLNANFPDADGVPQWLNSRYAIARRAVSG